MLQKTVVRVLGKDGVIKQFDAQSLAGLPQPRLEILSEWLGEGDVCGA